MKVGVIGAGTMGSGIAQAIASAIILLMYNFRFLLLPADES